MTDSGKLLAEYVSRHSEPAFRELVERYVGLVYSVALRLVHGDTHLAEDVTQTVFADLAGMARNLSEKVLLGGWLHQHTCFIANKTMRAARRRQAREREAAQMNLEQDHTEANLARIADSLDEAISQLGKEDRTAIILRYFEQYDLRSLGQVLGTTEGAAQKRVSRALEKLRALLTRRGVTISVAALGTALASETLTAAPAGLAASVAGTALAAGAAAESTLTLLNFMAATKLKAGILTAIVLASAVTPLLVQHSAQARLREQGGALRQRADERASLEAENERLSTLLAQSTSDQARSGEQLNELLRLRGETAVLRRRLQELAQPNAPAPMSRGDALVSKEKVWSGRVSQLKEWLAQHPSETVPEQRCLSNTDWLRTVYDATDYAQYRFNYDRQKLESDDDYRIAASFLRNSGEYYFADHLRDALRRYAQANNQQFPRDLSQLRPYFGPPVDDTMLQRWEIVAASSLVRELQPGGDWVITQKAPVDEALDVRIAVGLDGRKSSGISGATNRWALVH